MAKKQLTSESLAKLRARMVKHCFTVGHHQPEDMASEYVLRLLEGYHQSATVAQAYIDIIRLQSGRKVQNGKQNINYEKRQALTMVASSEEQEKFYTNQASVDNITLDQKLDLEKRLGQIKCERTIHIFRMYLMGYTGKEMADELGLTESRVNQIVNRTIQDLI